MIKSPLNSEVISTSFDDCGIKLWDTKNGKLINELIGHTNSACCLIVLPESTWGHIATGSFDKTVKLWCLDSGKCLKTFFGHADWVTCLAYLKTTGTLLSGSFDKKIKLWEMKSGLCLKTLKGTFRFSYLLVLPTGELLSSSGDSMKLWNLNKGYSTKELKGHCNTVNVMNFNLTYTKVNNT